MIHAFDKIRHGDYIMGNAIILLNWRSVSVNLIIKPAAHRDDGHLLPLSVTLRAIVRLAEHLTVRLIRCSASAPCGHMVGVHVGLLVNAFSICIVSDGAQRAIRCVVRLRSFGLLAIHGLACLLIEHADIQQALVLLSAENVLEDSLLIGNLRVVKQSLDTLCDLILRVCVLMILAV